MIDFIAATYKLELRLNGELIGDVRRLAQNLNWAKRRSRVGVDSISFTINDVQFGRWCEDRGTTLDKILKPLALDCRVIRNGIPLVGGFLATFPAYQPTGASADLTLRFDGYLNLLAGVYIAPQPTQTKPLSTMITEWITEAEERSALAGKNFGFYANQIDPLAVVTQSFEDYKDIKSYITERCDNTSGAGEFDFYFAPDGNYNILKSLGQDQTGFYVIQYPAQINIVSAMSFSAPEVSGFASCVIGVGNGETSGESDKDTAIISKQINTAAVQEYGYAETILSESSVSVQSTLDANTELELAQRSNMNWQPEIELSGRQINPEPLIVYNGKTYPSSSGIQIWVGDTIAIQNNADVTGLGSGRFVVNALEVTVASNGSESIKPSLSRDGTAVNNHSFAQEFVRMKSQLLALRSAS